MQISHNLLALLAGAQFSTALYTGPGHIGIPELPLPPTNATNATHVIPSTLPANITLPDVPTATGSLDVLIPCIKQLLQSTTNDGTTTDSCALLLTRAVAVHEVQALERRSRDGGFGHSHSHSHGHSHGHGHGGVRPFPFANRTQWTHVTPQGGLMTAASIPRATLTTVVMPKQTELM